MPMNAKKSTTMTLRQRRRRPPLDRRWILSLLLAGAASDYHGPLCSPPSFFFAAEALQITTFNVLAAVHRSMPPSVLTESTDAAAPPPPSRPPRESEQREWWGPRAEGLARYVAEELSSSDAVLLQEWWFSPEFEELFDRHTSHIFDRAAERRPGREDGMAVLINKRGKLELLESSHVLTGPQRIAQIAQCRERRGGGSGLPGMEGPGGRGKRRVTIANAHLSFPGDPDPVVNVRRQAMEVQIAARALDRAVEDASSSPETNFESLGLSSVVDDDDQSHLQIIGGDFNSNSLSLPAQKLESSKWGYVNSATATAALTMASGSIGGVIDLGVTHRTHRGEDVSVDHIFARTRAGKTRSDKSIDRAGTTAKGGNDGGCAAPALRGLGYLDGDGTRISYCQKRGLRLRGDGILSDHRPVTTVFEWPPPPPPSSPYEGGNDDGILGLTEERRWESSFAPDLNALGSGSKVGGMKMSLHPLQSPWDSP